MASIVLLCSVLILYTHGYDIYCVDEANLNFLFCRSEDEIAMDAIKHALNALRKRHMLEEGAHSPAFIALSRPFVVQVRLMYSYKSIYVCM